MIDALGTAALLVWGVVGGLLLALLLVALAVRGQGVRP